MRLDGIWIGGLLQPCRSYMTRRGRRGLDGIWIGGLLQRRTLALGSPARTLAGPAPGALAAPTPAACAGCKRSSSASSHMHAALVLTAPDSCSTRCNASAMAGPSTRALETGTSVCVFASASPLSEHSLNFRFSAISRFPVRRTTSGPYAPLWSPLRFSVR